MAKRKFSPEEKLAGFGMSDDLIKVFLSLVQENFVKDAIRIYENMDIVRNSLEDENSSYVLLRDGERSYDVNLEIVDDELEYFCNCSHRGGNGSCEHVGAVLLRKMLMDGSEGFVSKLKSKKEDSVEIDSGLGYFKDLFVEGKEEDKKNMIYFNFEDFDLDSQELKIQKGVIRKDGSYGAPLKFFGKDFNFMKWNISRNTRNALRFIYNEDNFEMGYSQNGFSKKRFYDIGTDLLMPVLRDIYFSEPEIILGASFSENKFKIVWDIKKNKFGKYIVEPMFVSGRRKKSLLNMRLVEIGNSSLWVFDSDERVFYGYVNSDGIDIIRSVIRFPKKLELGEGEIKEFFIKYYQKIMDSFEFSMTSDLKQEVRVARPVLNLYLERAGKSASVNLKFSYLGREVDYFSKNKNVVVVEDDVIYSVPRDMEEEDRIVEELNDCSVVTDEVEDKFVLDCDLADFLAIEIPKINKMGVNIFGEDKLFNFKVVKSRGELNIEIKDSVDWFDLKGLVKFGKEEVSFEKVVDAIFNNKRFIELNSGKRAIIPKEWSDEISPYFGFIDASDGLKISKSHIAVVERVSALAGGVLMEESIRSVFSKLKGIEKVEEVDIPKGIRANLREYQKVGYYWLNFLRDYGFNGVLADDMGLGKTLQSLTLLQKIKEEKKNAKFLIVVPTSLVFNWHSEINKFTTGIESYLHHGQKRFKTKEAFSRALEKNDLIITTYGVVRNDLKLFLDIEFDYLILDEAHIIKNPLSISAKSVYELKSKNRLVISGTPIQNNLVELWSLFNFLNPGYLGSYDFFREHFVSEIERNKNEKVTESLRGLINPFLLRRTKLVISDELPEKTEIVLHSSFTDSEKEVYENWKNYYKSEINSTIKEKGIGASRMKILEGLMKLRQVCLHPRLVDSRYNGSSAKFDLLMMELEKVLSDGHKVLVFSSFVKMLGIVKDELEKRGILYSYLDGKTKNREEVVSGFQDSKEARAFLISIKAGGVGLNLTSADYVFILDPWWNPAVEMQAMDRAHRIGQENKVFVYKMIAEGSIEEKILKLQKSKKKLVEDLIVEDEGVLKSISVKDVKEIFS